MNTARLGEEQLRTAAATGDTAKLTRLLRAVTKQATRLQIESTDVSGNSALMLAAQAGHAACVNMLVAAGANVNFARETDGKSPLIVAAVAGHLECIRILLARGADTEARSNFGNTAALLASFEGHTQVLSLLLSSGAHPSVRNTPHARTPLHYAASGGHVECVKLLLAAGADCDVVCSSGWTPAHAAASRGRGDCLWTLLSAAPDTASALDHGGLTPGDVAQENGHEGCMDMACQFSLGRRDVHADMHEPCQHPPAKQVQQEQNPPDNTKLESSEELQPVGGCLHREASVELPARPHEMNGYQRKLVLRQPTTWTRSAAQQRPTSAPATRGQAGFTHRSRGFVLNEARVRPLREEASTPPASGQEVSGRPIQNHRPVPPSNIQHGGGKDRPGSEQRPGSTVARVWSSSSSSSCIASTSTSVWKGRSHQKAAADNRMTGKDRRLLHDLSARRRRVDCLSEWHRHRHQAARSNQPGHQPPRRTVRNSAQAESEFRSTMLDDGSVGKLSEIWSMLNRKTAELADLEQQTSDSDTVGETGKADHCLENSGDRYFVPDSLDAEDSFLEPSKVVDENVGTMWARSARRSQGSTRRYPYASVEMWTRAIRVDSSS